MWFYFYWVQQFENVFETATVLYGYLEGKKKTNLIQFWVVTFTFTVTVIQPRLCVHFVPEKSGQKNIHVLY